MKDYGEVREKDSLIKREISQHVYRNWKPKVETEDRISLHDRADEASHSVGLPKGRAGP